MQILCKLYSQPAALLKKRLWHRWFPVNLAKFFWTPILQNTYGVLVLSCIHYFRCLTLIISWNIFRSFFFKNFTSKPLLPLVALAMFSSNCFRLFVDSLLVFVNDSFVLSDCIMLMLIRINDVTFRLLFTSLKIISHLLRNYVRFLGNISFSFIGKIWWHKEY